MTVGKAALDRLGRHETSEKLAHKLRIIYSALCKTRLGVARDGVVAGGLKEVE